MRSLEVWDWCPKKSPVEDLLDMLHLVESGQIISLLICSYLLSLKLFSIFSNHNFTKLLSIHTISSRTHPPTHLHMPKGQLWNYFASDALC